MIDQINKLIEPIKRRVLMSVARAVINLVDDSGKIQRQQVAMLEDEVRDQVERVQEYGFTSVPLPGAEAVTLFIGGNRDHGVVIATDDRRFRLKNLQSGEVAIYTDEGDKVVFKRGRVIEFTAGVRVEVIAPTVHMTGALNVDGPITSSTAVIDPLGSMQEMRGYYNAHTHSDPQGGSVGVTGSQMT